MKARIDIAMLQVPHLIVEYKATTADRRSLVGHDSIWHSFPGRSAVQPRQ